MFEYYRPSGKAILGGTALSAAGGAELYGKYKEGQAVKDFHNNSHQIAQYRRETPEEINQSNRLAQGHVNVGKQEFQSASNWRPTTLVKRIFGKDNTEDRFNTATKHIQNAITGN